jgi:hypothetical protein
MCKGAQENSNYIGPSPGLGDRLQEELPLANVQVTLRRDDEYTVGLDQQTCRDQFHRHLCVVRENFVEVGSYRPKVIDNDDSNTHIGRQMPQ